MESTYAVPMESETYSFTTLPDEYELEKKDPFGLEDASLIETGLLPLQKEQILSSRPLNDSEMWERKSRNHGDGLVQSSPSMDEPSTVSSSAGTTASEGKAAEEDDGLLSQQILNQASIRLGSETVLQPFNYLCSLGSKGVREKFIDALNVWIQAPEECVSAAKQISLMLHNSSLLLDDFQDSSNLRRGKPAAHTIFGPSQAVNSSSYLIILAMRDVLSSFGPHCLDQTIQQLLTLFIGQSFDIHWTYNSICPSVSEYVAMIDSKTGALFALLTDLLSSQASNDTPGLQMNTLARLMGRYFQVRDDYQNLMSADYASQKGFCEDLDEGKYSLPLIHLLRGEPANLLVRNMLSTRRLRAGLSLEQKMLVLEELKNAGSLAFTRDVLRRLHGDIGLEMDVLEGASGVENRLLRGLWEALRVE